MGNKEARGLTRAVLDERSALTLLASLLLLWEHLEGLHQLWHLAILALGRKGTPEPCDTWGCRTARAPSRGRRRIRGFLLREDEGRGRCQVGQVLGRPVWLPALSSFPRLPRLSPCKAPAPMLGMGSGGGGQKDPCPPFCQEEVTPLGSDSAPTSG